LLENLQSRLDKNANNLDTSDVVDTSSVEFSIGYGNTIEIDSIDVYSDQISSEMMSGVQDVIEDFFEKLEQVEEEETEEEEIPEEEVV